MKDLKIDSFKSTSDKSDDPGTTPGSDENYNGRQSKRHVPAGYQPHLLQRRSFGLLSGLDPLGVDRGLDQRSRPFVCVI